MLQGLQGTPLDDGDLVAGEFILGKKLTKLKLHKLDKLGVIHHVNLVQEDDDVGNTDLTGKEDVLTGLGHRAVVCADNEDRAIHLGRAGDHVLDVVGVTGAVYVGIVTVIRLVLDVGRSNGDTALLLLRSLIDLVKGYPLRHPLIGKAPGNG